MLGVTTERFPSGGALLLAITGAAGNLSVAITLALIGRVHHAGSGDGVPLRLRAAAGAGGDLHRHLAA